MTAAPASTRLEAGDLAALLGQLFRHSSDRAHLRDAATLPGALRANHFAEHVEGRARIGAIPFVSDTDVRWACIDFDVTHWGFEPDDPEVFAIINVALEELALLGLRGALERSRSKGWHVWAFFAEPVPAASVRRVFLSLLRRAGVPDEGLGAEDLICPRADAAPKVGNGTYLPLSGQSESPFTRFYDLDPDSDDWLPAEDQAAVLASLAESRSPVAGLLAAAADAHDDVPPGRANGTGRYEKGGRHEFMRGATMAVASRGTPFREAMRELPAIVGKLAPAPGDDAVEIARRALELMASAADKAEPRPRLRTLAGIERRAVSWLWHGRIPLGKVTVLDGDPGLGKSTLTLDLAARVTRGATMPDGSSGGSGTVLLLSAEDDAADTIGPRFDAAGGDPARCVLFETVGSGDRARPPELPTDADELEDVVRDAGVRLVIIDPLVAFLSDEVKTGNDHAIRRALLPLKGIAERTGAAVLLVRHLNKDKRNGSAVYRGGGSIGIIGAARSGLMVARDPAEPDLRVLAVTKANLAPADATASLAFRVEPAPTGVGVVAWLGESSHSADDLVRPTADGDGAIGQALDFLREQLADGPVLSDNLKRDAEAAGIASRTLTRARTSLGVVARKRFDGRWTSDLPARGRR